MPRRPRLGWLLVVAAVAALAAAGRGLAGEAAPQVHVLSHATVIATPSQAAPPGSSVGRRVSLPYSATIAPRAQHPQALYRFDIGLEASPTGLWGILLPGVEGNAVVRVNGVAVGRHGRLRPPVSVYWNQPLYFSVPEGVLTAGRNRVEVSVAGYFGRAVLQPPRIGPAIALQEQARRLQWLNVTLPLIASALALIIAALVGLLWLRRRHHAMYLWLSVAILLWALQNASYFVHDRPLAPEQWEATIATLRLWLLVCMVLFTHRFLGLRRRRPERALSACAAAGTLVLWSLPAPSAWPHVLPAIGAIVLIGGVYVTAVFVRAAWRQHSAGLRALAALGALMLAAGTFDWLARLGLFDPGQLKLMTVAAPLMVLAVGWLMIEGFVQALRDSEALNRDLESRIATKHAELEANYDSLRQLEHERTLSAERERIMRDVHDGMGGQLVSTLAMVESGRCERDELAEALRRALDDMRLVIDSLDPTVDDIPTLLGTFRGRLEPRLKRSGLGFRWKVRDMPAPADFGPEQSLGLMRILQEAVSNVLEHAGASVITVATGATAEGWPYVEIVDDGIGIATGSAERGNGIAAMRRRAHALGAALRVEPAHPGTRICVELPPAAGLGAA